MQLEPGSGGLAPGVVSPLLEMGAYEALWLRQGTTFRSLAARFAARPVALLYYVGRWDLAASPSVATAGVG